MERFFQRKSITIKSIMLQSKYFIKNSYEMDHDVNVTQNIEILACIKLQKGQVYNLSRDHRPNLEIEWN